MGRCRSQNAEELSETLLVEIPGDQGNARAAICSGPPGQAQRGAEHVLGAMQQNRSGPPRDINDCFDLQQTGPGKIHQEFQPGAQVFGCNWIVQSVKEGSDPCATTDVGVAMAGSLPEISPTAIVWPMSFGCQ